MQYFSLKLGERPLYGLPAFTPERGAFDEHRHRRHARQPQKTG